jgi:hypothetical protein
MAGTIQIYAPAGRVDGPDRSGPQPGVEPAIPRSIRGQVAVGNRITLRSVHPAHGRLRTVKPKITVADPGAELRWVASLPGTMTGEHSFALTPPDGGTRLEQSETFRAASTVFSGKTFTRAEASFRELNEALKQRAEGS